MNIDEERLAGMSREALESLQESLDQLEAEDPNVRAAREKLDQAIDNITRKAREDREAAERAEEERKRNCEHCGVPKFTHHHESCPVYGTQPTREAGGYQYLNEDFEVLHVTSVPITDKEALEYFVTVAGWFASSRIKYIWRRAMWETEFKMMPFEFDREAGEVVLIGGDPIPEGMLDRDFNPPPRLKEYTDDSEEFMAQVEAQER